MRRRGFGEDGCVFCCGPSLGRGLGLVLAVVKCCWCFGGWDPQQSPELGLVPDLPVLASLGCCRVSLRLFLPGLQRKRRGQVQEGLISCLSPQA